MISTSSFAAMKFAASRDVSGDDETCAETGE